jgi:hypothetical protein
MPISERSPRNLCSAGYTAFTGLLHDRFLPPSISYLAFDEDAGRIEIMSGGSRTGDALRSAMTAPPTRAFDDLHCGYRHLLALIDES